MILEVTAIKLFFHYKLETVSSLPINRNRLKFKKHTVRKAGAMATSCFSTNQTATVKTWVPLAPVIFFKIFNSTKIYLC